MKAGCSSLARLVASTFILAVLFPSLAAAQSSSSAATDLPVAQEGGIPVRNDFQVSPTRFVLEMDPGEEREVRISLISRSGEPYSFSLVTEDFAADEKEDVHLFGDIDGPFTARRWAKPQITQLNLDHGQRATIPVTVSVPANATVGDHYVAVLFQRDPKEGPQAGFNIIARVGVLLLITVKRPTIKKGNLVDFHSLFPVYWWLPAHFSLRYRNEGTVHPVSLSCKGGQSGPRKDNGDRKLRHVSEEARNRGRTRTIAVVRPTVGPGNPTRVARVGAQGHTPGGSRATRGRPG